MAKREARRKNGIEAVAIVTPNHMHAPGGARVPEARHPRDLRQAADRDAAEARKLAKAAAESDALFVLTHNYTGYPMIRQARAMVADGTIGQVRVVQVEYAQDWLATPLEDSGSEAGRLAHRPGALGQGRLDRRHRHPRLQPRELRHRPDARGARRRPAGLRAGAARRRQRPRAAALRGRRARHALVQPGRRRQRERAAPPRLWREGRARVGAGGPELPLVHAARRAEASADPRRRRGGARRRAGQPHAGRPSRRATSKASPPSTPRRRGRSSRGATASRCRPDVVFPTIEDGVAGVAFVDACVRSSERNAAWVSL